MRGSRREEDRVEDRADRESLVPDDEIEILEVVGLDGDEAPVRKRRSTSREVAVEIEPQAAEAREQLLRLSADFENFRRRVDRDREAHERHATASLITRLLPVLDNFERALARENGGSTERFFDGVVLIFRQLLDELRAEGLHAVDSVGEPFDPQVHEAVATAEEDALPPNIVVEELQRGYRLHGRLLRPALVRVTVDGGSAGSTRRGAKGA